MRRLLLATIAIISLLAGVSASLGIQGSVAEAAALPDYGAGAYAGSNPIGGGDGYVSSHGYSEATADYVVTTASQLSSALSSATSGDVIWVPGDVTITISGSYGKTVKTGVALASDRGLNGSDGGKIYWSLTTASSFMQPLFYGAAGSVFSGLRLEGVTGYSAMGNSGLCAIRTSGKHVEVENCEISKFTMGGVWCQDGNACSPWNDDSQRHIIHHCYIHNIQQHGEGYGIGDQGNGISFLAEACIIENCRHCVMGQANPTNYEVRYCIIGDSLYGLNGDSSNLYHNQQIDCHGNDDGSSSPSAGNHLWIHHNTISANTGTTSNGNNQNVRIRGVPQTECLVYHNWTKKTTHSGLYTETSPGNGAFTQSINGSSFTKMSVHDNWYGTTPPPSTNSTNHAPVLSTIGNKSIAAGSKLSFTVSATDSDGNSLTYSASNLPSGAAFSTSTRTFSWTPASAQAGTYGSVRFQVSDGSLSDSEDISITVTGQSTNHAPVLGTIGNKSVAAGSTLSFTVSATDSDGNSLTYSASNLPSGAAFNASTRIFSWTPTSAQAGSYSSVRFQVSDGSLSDFEDISITVAAVSRLIGDVNSDGSVNSLDMICVRQHWGETGTNGWIPEDINQDGSVSVLDATLVGQHWTG